METALRESLLQYRALFDRSPLPMCVVALDADGILAANDAAAALFAMPAETLLASRFSALGAQPIAATDPAGGEARAFTDHGIHTLRRRDGALFDAHLASFPVRFQERPARLVQIEDLSERRHYEARIEYLATHDGLTALPNRTLLEDRAQQALLAARRAGEGLGVLLLGLGRLKDVNESFGHAGGDQVIREAASRIRIPLREGDTVARFGGDTFAVLLPGLRRPEDAEPVIRKIQRALAEPFIIRNREVFLTASVGVSVFPVDGDDVPELLRNADAARRIAKERDGNAVQYFAAELSTRSLARIELEGDLRRALERREFEVHYQPQVDLYTSRIVGAEALLRWRRPEEGLVPPGRFIQAAEDTGLIVPLGGWMLHAACEQARRWSALGLPEVRISVNVSARQFRDRGLEAQIREALDTHGLDPRRLELELTEGLVMDDAEAFIGTLGRLKALGIGIAIDDFGTGYSSLSYLKRFPIDKLKIDQSFVRTLPESADDAAIARTVIALGRSLGLKVIAEGVETFGQLEFLRTQGCDEVQGYYFARPLEPERFGELLARGLEPALWRGRPGGL
jgi:diguanylate cyclase (GGDEF)-like protein/PAS domain S-box-containing protein